MLAARESTDISLISTVTNREYHEAEMEFITLIFLVVALLKATSIIQAIRWLVSSGDWYAHRLGKKNLSESEYFDVLELNRQAENSFRSGSRITALDGS